MNRLEIIKNALLGVSESVYRYTAGNNPKVPYIVWAEDSENSFAANGRREETAQQGTIDLYTKNEADPLRESIPAALNACGCCWYKNSTQYEKETGLIHDEWVFEV